MTILQRLKQETHPWHVALESRVDIQARLKDRNAYRELLSAFYGFYAPVEQALLATAANSDICLELKSRTKVPWLVQDLQILGSDPSSTPVCEQLPELPHPAAALGCLYVLEGATLGGRYITKMLLPLGITPTTGGAFFESYGDQVGARWAEFQQAVVCYATSEERADQIVASATTTFQRFHTWIDGTLSPRA